MGWRVMTNGPHSDWSARAVEVSQSRLKIREVLCPRQYQLRALQRPAWNDGRPTRLFAIATRCLHLPSFPADLVNVLTLAIGKMMLTLKPQILQNAFGRPYIELVPPEPLRPVTSLHFVTVHHPASSDSARGTNEPSALAML
jgi:hypothetical protein